MDSIENMASGNMDVYNKVRSVPENALKPITGGRLKGKTEISPMWRIKMLTQVFGPVGFGWYTEMVNKWTEITENGETVTFVEINLYVRKDGEWSRPIFGTGGAKLISMENKWVDGVSTQQPYIDDDAYKKAYTDAISVCAKALGIGADVYWEDDSVYETQSETQQQMPAYQAAQVAARSAGLPVLSPKNPLWKQAVAFTAGQPFTSEEVAARIRNRYTISDENLNLLLIQSGKLDK